MDDGQKSAEQIHKKLGYHPSFDAGCSKDPYVPSDVSCCRLPVLSILCNKAFERDDVKLSVRVLYVVSQVAVLGLYYYVSRKVSSSISSHPELESSFLAILIAHKDREQERHYNTALCGRKDAWPGRTSAGQHNEQRL